MGGPGANGGCASGGGSRRGEGRGEAALPCRLLRHARFTAKARGAQRIRLSRGTRLNLDIRFGIRQRLLPLLRAQLACVLNFLLLRGPLLGRKRPQGAVLALLQSAFRALLLARLRRGRLFHRRRCCCRLFRRRRRLFCRGLRRALGASCCAACRGGSGRAGGLPLRRSGALRGLPLRRSGALRRLPLRCYAGRRGGTRCGCDACRRRRTWGGGRPCGRRRRCRSCGRRCGSGSRRRRLSRSGFRRLGFLRKFLRAGAQRQCSRQHQDRGPTRYRFCHDTINLHRPINSDHQLLNGAKSCFLRGTFFNRAFVIDDECPVIFRARLSN